MTMEEIIYAHDLGAFDAQNIMLMGMPNIGADYISHGKKTRHILRQDAACCGCGRQATQGHHLVPKGMGGARNVYNRQTDFGTFELLSPILAVCGLGNSSGCHGKFHHQGGFLTASWLWESFDSYDLWDTGELWRDFEPNSDELYQLGFWLISDGKNSWKVQN